MFRRTVGCLFLFLLLVSSVSAQRSPREEYRIMWVDVFHEGLLSPSQIDTLLSTARSANYNALLVQMRKAADAYYNSSVEPRNANLPDDFDPLGYLIQRAHNTPGQSRIEVHAWIVAYRCRIPYDDTYKNPRHVFQQHPEWLNKTNSGKTQIGGENAGRMYLDPGVPQVIDHNLNVVRDILSNYDVDGIHFDYIRYPESPGSGNVWGYNPVSLARFQKQYGRTDKPAPDDPQWSEFRRQQIEFMVRKAYAHVRAWRPRVKVSAATIAWAGIDKGFESSSAYTNIMQDWQSMALNGWLDVMIPMNYKRERVADQARDHREWARYLGQLALRSDRFGVNGVDGEELNSLEGIISQMKATRQLPGITGIATYCYAQTRAGKSNPPDLPFFDAIRKNFYGSPAAVPRAGWLEQPIEGYVKGVVSSKGQVADAAVVTVGDRQTLTDGTGFYAFARLAPGEYSVTASHDGRRSAPRRVTVQPGRVAECAVTVD